MSRKIDYDLKAKVIENGMVDIQRKVSLTRFKQRQKRLALETGEVVNDWQPLTNEQCDLLSQYETINPIEWKEAERVNDASYHRTKRLKTKISRMLTSGSCIFLTLTFRDDVLNNTTKETRKRYVARALKTMSDRYIANIDYGSKKEREHYHAIVLADKVSQDNWLYGNLDFERVRIHQDDSNVRIAKYMNKLTNHAIKETTKQNRLIYSRL